MITDCIESVDKKHFYIQDGVNQKPAFIVEENGEFEVINNTDNSIEFLQIDACLFNSNDTTRCDCAVYDNNTFCFIELKCIKPSAFSKNRKKAEEQLEATIKYFNDENITQNKTLEAYVCSNCKIKLDDTFEPITQRPKNREKELYFISSLNTLLYYDTKKEFN